MIRYLKKNLCDRLRLKFKKINHFIKINLENVLNLTTFTGIELLIVYSEDWRFIHYTTRAYEGYVSHCIL